MCDSTSEELTCPNGPALDWTRCTSKAANDERTELNRNKEVEQMLILSRKNGDSIVIDGGIRITVTAIKGNVVQLGTEAPKTIPILRGELSRKDSRVHARSSSPLKLTAKQSR
jgi:carbon storage regulator